MKVLTSFSALSIFFMLHFSSCDKQESVTPEDNNLDKSTLRPDIDPVLALISTHSHKTWQIQEATLYGQSVVGVLVPECGIDNHLVLHRNGLFMEFEGPTRCEKNAPYLFEKGSWELVNEGKVIELLIHDGKYSYEIIDLSENIMNLRLIGPNPIELHLIALKKRK